MEQRIKGKVKGKAIIGIAVAAIMLASLMAVLPGMSSEERLIIKPPIEIDPGDKVEKAMARLDPSILPIDPSPIQLPIIEIRQLTLAGTPLKIAAVEGLGLTVEKVLLKALAGDKMMEIEKEHVYQLGEHEIMVVFSKDGEENVERLMKVIVVDTKAPAIKVEDKFISQDETMFSIRIIDDCDAAPVVSAVMMLPCMDDLKIRQKEAAEVEVEIDLKEMTAVLKGPAKVRAMMREKSMMQVMMNEKMLIGQEIVINLEKEVIKDGVKYKYRANGRTLEIEGYTDLGVTREMVVTAMDASGKVAEQIVPLALLGKE